ncbi:LppP/LprE family lipoprotein [Streptomyces pimonensis]|uniref:LppP/LprE family lipoprotein n=1 Tax=Streptomyces pimonensis TaxID=2860288 RepID=A0ABV4J1R7_9ACTN
MRGLTGTGPTRARTAARAAGTATTALAAAVLFAGCGTGGTGARDEGPAHADSVASAPAAAASAQPSRTPDRAEAVRLVKADPAVSAEVKRELQPCVADEYPVDVSYGDLTRGDVDDVVVNVLTCGDAVGVGSYVYREQDGAYVNAFSAEEPPVYAEIDRGDLVVTKQVYDPGDPVASPSGENVITYRWGSGRFTEKYRTHNDYGQVAVAEPSPGPAG